MLLPLDGSASVVVEVVNGRAVDDVNVLPLDVRTVTEVVKTVTEPLLAFADVAFDEVGPDVAAAELAFVEAGPDVVVSAEFDAAPEDLSPPLVLGDPEVRDGAFDPEVKEELGTWAPKNCMLWPVLLGSEHILVRVFESVNATVADAATVQLQYAPGWRVEGSPS